MSKYKIVKFAANYADEFDIDGIRIFEEKDWDEYVENMHIEWPDEWYFGTNEFIEFQSFEDFMSKFTINTVSGKRAQYFNEMVGSIGFFPEY